MQPGAGVAGYRSPGAQIQMKMRNRLVVVPSIVELITKSPGFEKKDLAERKLDLVGLCGFGCVYCSSNNGYYLRSRREPFADLTEAQLGERVYPEDDPSLSFVWADALEKLERQLARKKKSWGRGETLVFSMLTDGFSPSLVASGTTRAALELVLKHSSFRIRVLTKNSIVASSEWIEFFRQHPGRFVVGLSTGTTDDAWAKRIEIGTSLPSARLRALRALQDAAVPTYGMLCPIFPSVLEGRGVEELVEQIRPDRCETVWGEPYNDRANWTKVRDGHDPGSAGHQWFDRAFASGRDGWSAYAVDLYVRMRDIAREQGWLAKLKFLLYEDAVTALDAPRLAGLHGIMLQSKPGPDGRSANPFVAALQPAADVYAFVRGHYGDELVAALIEDGIALSWDDAKPRRAG
jgi:DNA repair photolyase